ncbi:MAG TPA: AAA family ATPase [Chitinophagales bacterium]|nr:AAA family ATPase [Chitinophagales bacterium]
MITQLSIANFKPFLHLDINLSNLNILTGLNGMGKSSLIQALLLLRQSFSDGVLTQGLRINGDLVELGTANDIFNKLSLIN